MFRFACYMIEPNILHVLHIILFILFVFSRIHIHISLNENVYHVENSIISKENVLDDILKPLLELYNVRMCSSSSHDIHPTNFVWYCFKLDLSNLNLGLDDYINFPRAMSYLCTYLVQRAPMNHCPFSLHMNH